MNIDAIPIPVIIAIIVGLGIFAAVFFVFVSYSSKIEEMTLPFLKTYQEKLEKEFANLDMPITAQRFMILQGGIALVLFTLGLITGSDIVTKVVVGALFALIGIFLTRTFIKEKKRQWQQRFEEQFADAAAMVGNGVKAGLSLLQALELTSHEIGNPFARELKAVLQAHKMGNALDVALNDWSARMDCNDLDIFVTAINIQHQTGGNLSEILSILGNTIRERRRIKGQIQTLTAQGRMSAYILSGLPVVLFLAIYFVNTAQVSLMFTHYIGWMMLGACAIMVGIGMVVVNMIVDINI